ncbi:uncharacterized protein LOC122040657 [Zingiber officinale]|uniref:uncharacterized protein LOC122040657 n=1 Tax=Zingiber officinale TaxID=94328 RepID=UPI001C4DB63F|nr:uncharacterized protein LOC122040657 [Zingiber officinale]
MESPEGSAGIEPISQGQTAHGTAGASGSQTPMVSEVPTSTIPVVPTLTVFTVPPAVPPAVYPTPPPAVPTAAYPIPPPVAPTAYRAPLPPVSCYYIPGTRTSRSACGFQSFHLGRTVQSNRDSARGAESPIFASSVEDSLSGSNYIWHAQARALQFSHGIAGFCFGTSVSVAASATSAVLVAAPITGPVPVVASATSPVSAIATVTSSVPDAAPTTGQISAVGLISISGSISSTASVADSNSDSGTATSGSATTSTLAKDWMNSRSYQRGCTAS